MVGENVTWKMAIEIGKALSSPGDKISWSVGARISLSAELLWIQAQSGSFRCERLLNPIEYNHMRNPHAMLARIRTEISHELARAVYQASV